SYWRYAYDPKGELTSAKHYWADGGLVPGQQFEYDYDDVGNRPASREGGDATGAGLRATSYVPNDLNQYTSRSTSLADRKADVIGLAAVVNGTPTAVNITVNGAAGSSPDYRRGEYFWKAVAASGAGPNWLTIGVSAGSSSANGGVYVPPQNESFGMDADGNSTSDARWLYKWD